MSRNDMIKKNYCTGVALLEEKMMEFGLHGFAHVRGRLIKIKGSSEKVDQMIEFY